jgi:hypothetical protein
MDSYHIDEYALFLHSLAVYLTVCVAFMGKEHSMRCLLVDAKQRSTPLPGHS